MLPIARTGTIVTVTPGDVAFVRGPGDFEHVHDRTPFSLVVSGIIEENGQLVGVYGRVILGHPRYLDQVATLLLRVDNSDWRRDNRSGANFKIARSAARLNGQYPLFHPEGSNVDGFPYFMRYGSVDSRSEGEATVNSAVDCYQKEMAALGATPSGGPVRPSCDSNGTQAPPSVN